MWLNLWIFLCHEWYCIILCLSLATCRAYDTDWQGSTTAGAEKSSGQHHRQSWVQNQRNPRGELEIFLRWSTLAKTRVTTTASMSTIPFISSWMLTTASRVLPMYTLITLDMNIVKQIASSTTKGVLVTLPCFSFQIKLKSCKNMNSAQQQHEHHHWKVLIKSFHLSGHSFRFRWMFQDLEVFLV